MSSTDKFSVLGSTYSRELVLRIKYSGPPVSKLVNEQAYTRRSRVYTQEQYYRSIGPRYIASNSSLLSHAYISKNQFQLPSPKSQDKTSVRLRLLPVKSHVSYKPRLINHAVALVLHSIRLSLTQLPDSSAVRPFITSQFRGRKRL